MLGNDEMKLIWADAMVKELAEPAGLVDEDYDIVSVLQRIRWKKIQRSKEESEAASASSKVKKSDSASRERPSQLECRQKGQACQKQGS